VIGQGGAVATIRRLIGRRGFDRGALWIEGDTGIGKTAIAQATARALKCDRWATIEIDGDACGVERVRELTDTIGLGVLGGGDGWRVYIVNEAHAMPARAIQAWLTLLERLPARRLVIFTSTEDTSNLFGGFNQPFMDRTIGIRLSKVGLKKQFARLAQAIARREGLDGKPLSAYERLVHVSRGSMRAALAAVERGDMIEPERPAEEAARVAKFVAGGRRANETRAKRTRKTKTTRKAKK